MKNLMALCGALCALSLSLQGAQAPLVISEIMAENDSGLVDENGNRVDWIEIQNVSSEHRDLENFASLMIGQTLTQWSFPEQSLAPGAFLIVFASGKDRAADQDALHTNFSLSNQGEYLALIDKTEGQPIHEMTPSFPPQQSDVSFGLPADWRMGQPLVMQALREATPGKANASAVLGRLSKIRFSQKRGFQSQSFELSLELEEATARIRYTTDGSIPTEEHGNLYEGPWSIAQTTVIRARAFGDGYLPSRTVTRTYLFPSDIVRPVQMVCHPLVFPTTGEEIEWITEWTHVWWTTWPTRMNGRKPFDPFPLILWSLTWIISLTSKPVSMPMHRRTDGHGSDPPQWS